MTFGGIVNNNTDETIGTLEVASKVVDRVIDRG
jgi:hypothetical protein